MAKKVTVRDLGVRHLASLEMNPLPEPDIDSREGINEAVDRIWAAAVGVLGYEPQEGDVVALLNEFKASVEADLKKIVRKLLSGVPQEVRQAVVLMTGIHCGQLFLRNLCDGNAVVDYSAVIDFEDEILPFFDEIAIKFSQNIRAVRRFPAVTRWRLAFERAKLSLPWWLE